MTDFSADDTLPRRHLQAVVVEPLPEPTIEAAQFTDLARTLVITDDDSYERAAECLKGGLTLLRDGEERFKEPKRKLDDAKKSLLSLERSVLDPIRDGISKLKLGLQVYRTQQQARAEAERKQREADARRLETDRKLDEAVEAESAGDPELAAAIMNEEIVVPIVAAARPVAKVPGLSSRETWHAEVVDKGAFIRWVAQDVAERGHLLDVNMPNANARARAMKDAMNTPGLRAVKDTGLAMRIR